MIIPYHKELENPNRTLEIKLAKERERIYIHDKDWVDTDETYYMGDEWDKEESSKLLLPGFEPVKTQKIIPSSQLHKMSPEQRADVLKILQSKELAETREEAIKLKLLSSFLSPTGELIDMTSTHKNNNFYYQWNRGMNLIGAPLYPGHKQREPIYLEGFVERLKVTTEKELRREIAELIGPFSVYRIINRKSKEYTTIGDSLHPLHSFLIPIHVSRAIKKINSSRTPLDSYNYMRKAVLKELSELKKGNSVTSHHIRHWFNLIGSDRYSGIILNGEEYGRPSQDYSEEVWKNIIGLTSGELAIRECFIEIAHYIYNADEVIPYIFKDMTDFFVLMVGFDKIETTVPKAITTSRLNIYESFYNYLIMGWNIYQLHRYQVNKKYGVIERVDNDSDFSFINNSPSEREFKKEITLIKKLPLEERYKYLI